MRKGIKLDPALKEKRATRKKILSQRLTQILKEKNLSQTELALKTNLTDQVISDYCVGRAIPRSAGLLKIASVLDIHEGWLLGDFDEIKPFPMGTKSKELLNENKHLLLELDQIAQVLTIINSSSENYVTDYQEIIKKILQLNSAGILKLIDYADDLTKLKEYRFTKVMTQDKPSSE